MRFFLLFLFFINIYANDTIKYSWLKQQPRSIAKDFYIYRYLDQDITPSQALKALGEARYVNNKIFVRFAKKFKDKDTTKVANCLKYKAHTLVKQDSDCIEIGMTTYKATKLNSNELETIINKLSTLYPNSANIFQIISSKNKFQKLIHSTSKVFFDTFNQCGGKFRAKYFNHQLPLDFINKIKDNKQFAQTINLIVTNPKLNIMQQSLFDINTTNLSHLCTFNLAINSIRHHKDKSALKYLKKANKKAYFQMNKDKVLFWQYLLTNKKQYLIKLSKSWDINIYSLYAFDKLNKPIANVIYNIDVKLKKYTDFDYKTPFAWFRILKDTKKKISKKKMQKYDKLLNTKETLGHLAFIKERFYRYKKSYFITPYYDLIKQYPKEKQILIYALARQESRFIPASISTSYALGLMQIMPFLSKNIAKQNHLKYDIDKQLLADTSIKYASIHLDYLKKYLNNPLYIAYAYNAGIGFTKRLLKSKGFFTQDRFEPFISMELIPYLETRKYGKKVLANYYIYKKHLVDNNFKFHNLFNNKSLSTF